MNNRIITTMLDCMKSPLFGEIILIRQINPPSWCIYIGLEKLHVYISMRLTHTSCYCFCPLSICLADDSLLPFWIISFVTSVSCYRCKICGGKCCLSILNSGWVATVDGYKRYVLCVMRNKTADHCTIAKSCWPDKQRNCMEVAHRSVINNY